LINEGGKVEVIGPSESAHGFANARGPKRYIPDLHREAFQSTLQDLLNQSTWSTTFSRKLMGDTWTENFSFTAYARNNWTYHSKGLWWQKERVRDKSDNKIDGNDGDSELQSGCYIGSSNFGIRSWTRDFELGFLFSTVTPSTVNAHGVPNNSARTSSVFVEDLKNLQRFTTTDKRTKNLMATARFGGNASWLTAIARLVKSVL
jgi:phosphatidylserine/phosphatidylglycerophosphate/cardiolipin synthase-like enzyme